MPKPKVLLAWSVSPEERAVVDSLWPGDVEVVDLQTRDAEVLMPVMPEIDVLVGFMNAEMLARADRLKLVHVLGHGVDFLQRPGMREPMLERGIKVANAKAGAICIAEFAIMSMIALTRRAFKFHEELAYRGGRLQDVRRRRMEGAIGGELYGSTLGILGFGAIGQEIAIRARAFGMTIGVVRRNPAKVDLKEYGVSFTATLDDLDAFLGRCDYLVLALPSTPDTRDVLTRDRFQKIKDGAFLVNIARGSLVDEQALYEALASGKLAGAGLDVWRERDDSSPRDYPIPYPIHHYNVIMTPHYSGSTREARLRALRTVGENLRRFANGEPLINEVDLEIGF